MNLTDNYTIAEINKTFIENSNLNRNEFCEKLFEAKHICWGMLVTQVCKCCGPENIMYSKILTGGLSNTLIKVTILKDKFCDNMKNANREFSISNLKVRFYAKERKLFVNEKREELIQRLIAKYEIGKPVLLYFNGGQVEEFIEGKTLEVEDVRKRPTYLSIAEKIAKLHSIKITKEIVENIYEEFKHKNIELFKYEKIIDNETSIIPTSILWPTLDDWLNRAEKIIYNNRFFKKIDTSNLRELINKLKTYLYTNFSNSNACSIVLCHSDLLPGNIIETNDKDHIFIDYEFSGTIERMFDIGNHLCEWAGLNCEWNHLPDDKILADFLSTYIRYLSNNEDSGKKEELENCHSNQEIYLNLNFKNSNYLNKSLMKEYITSVKIFMVISNIFWGLWAICKSDLKPSNIGCNFDYGSYGYRKLDSINSEKYFRNILQDIDPNMKFPIF